MKIEFLITAVSAVEALQSLRVSELDDARLLEWMKELFEKMDGDQNGLVDHFEINQWIHKLDKQQRIEQAQAKFKDYNHDQDEGVSIEEYEKELGKTHSEARFRLCDFNEDGLHDAKEFEDCLFPHESERHVDDYLQREFKNIDTNSDFVITENELARSQVVTGIKAKTTCIKKILERDNQSQREVEFSSWDEDDSKDISMTEFKTHMHELLTIRQQQKAVSVMEHDQNGDAVFELDEFLGNSNLLARTKLTHFGNMLHHEL